MLEIVFWSYIRTIIHFAKKKEKNVSRQLIIVNSLY